MSDTPFRQEMSRTDLEACAGRDVFLSRWFDVSQARIDGFAEITEDRQFIHVDPARARETAFGGTVAHGMLTLSLLSAMAYDAFPAVAGMISSVNYGFDRIRFVTPVASGSKLRGRFMLEELDTRRPDQLMARVNAEVEIHGQTKLALIAQWRVVYVLAPNGRD